MIQMIPKNKLSSLTILKTAVETARMAGGNHISVAEIHLSKKSFSYPEVMSFLETFGWDIRLVQVVLSTTQLTTKEILTILEKKKFDRDLCITAGEKDGVDEHFIVTMIVNCYAFGANCAKVVTQQFKDVISQSGAINLLKYTDNDPAIAKVINDAVKAV